MVSVLAGRVISSIECHLIGSFWVIFILRINRAEAKFMRWNGFVDNPGLNKFEHANTSKRRAIK